MVWGGACPFCVLLVLEDPKQCEVTKEMERVVNVRETRHSTIFHLICNDLPSMRNVHLSPGERFSQASTGVHPKGPGPQLVGLQELV